MSRSIIEEMADILSETIALSESMEREGWQRTPQVQQLYERAKAVVKKYGETTEEVDFSQFF